MEKACKICNKSIDRSKRSETYLDICNSCWKKDYYTRNKAALNAKNAAYYNEKVKKVYSPIRCALCGEEFVPSSSAVKCCSRQCSDKKWRSEHKVHIRDYHHGKYHSDINRRLATCLRSRINKALKGAYKSASVMGSLGCSPDQLRIHLQSLFLPGMSWENYGRKKGITCWEVDHINSLASVDLSNPEQLKIACHYTNLQPLWATDNLRKGAR